jgi:U3 small nucleolar ribonucleoprotein protein IMP3
MRSLAHRLALLPAQDPFRARMEAQILSKLYDMGVLNLESKLSDVENKLTVAAFCRRRLGVVMTRLKMAETVSAVCPSCQPYTSRLCSNRNHVIRLLNSLNKDT